MPMLRVSTMPIIASFRKALVAVDRLYPTRSAMLVNTTGPPFGYNLASAAITSRSLYDRLLSISFITFIVKTHLLSLLLAPLPPQRPPSPTRAPDAAVGAFRRTLQP